MTELEAAQQRLEAKRRALGIEWRGPKPLNALVQTGERLSRARVAHLVHKHGRRVRCTECGVEQRAHTHAGERLRSLGCAHCGGRLRPLNWRGWDAAR